MAIFSPPVVPVETKELTVAATEIEFTGLSSSMFSLFTARHLYLILSGACETAQAARDVELQFNSDTGNNYGDQHATGIISTASAARAIGQASMTIMSIPGSDWDADAFGGGVFLIPNAFGTVGMKGVLAQGGAAEQSTKAVVGMWANTGAITSIKIFLSGGQSFRAGTRATLCVVDERCLIAETILSGGDANFDFPILPSTDSDGDLCIIASLRSNRAADVDTVELEFNADGNIANYDNQNIKGVNTTVSASIVADLTAGRCVADGGTTSYFSPFIAEIKSFNRPDNDPFTTCLSGFVELTGPDSEIRLANCKRDNVEAITRVEVLAGVGTAFKDGSMASIYLTPKRPVFRTVAVGTVTSYTPTIPTSGVEAIQLGVYGRSDDVGAGSVMDIQHSGVTADAQYAYQHLRGIDTAVSAATDTNEKRVFLIPGAGVGANIFSGGTAMIFSPHKTDRDTMRAAHMGTMDNVYLFSSRFIQKIAVTTMLMDMRADDGIVAGTVITTVYILATGNDVSDRTHLPTKAMA